MDSRTRIRASQACDKCRQKKQKCSEERPSCAACVDAGIQCHYKKFAPGKSDRIMSHILDRLNSLEVKIDKIGGPGNPSLSATKSAAGKPTMAFRHTTAAHKILLWPVIQSTMKDTPEFIAVQDPVAIEAARSDYEHTAKVPDLAITAELVEAYLTYFHILQPILDESVLRRSAANIVLNDLREDLGSSVLLFVMAIGALCLNYDHRTYFFTARRILSASSRICLERVQCHLLSAMYFAQLIRPLDSWREIASACSLIMVVIFLPGDGLSADLRRRAFWSALILESDLLAELDLPPSGITRYENEVSLPFQIQEDGVDDSVRFHFLAHIACRRLLNRVHGELYTNRFSAQVAKELDFQILSWRKALPQQLQWDDNEMPSISINNARLRMKYYAARYVIHRPFVQAALIGHPPQQKEIEICLENTLKASTTYCRVEKLFVTNLFGTALGVWGMMLVLEAAKRGHLGNYTWMYPQTLPMLHMLGNLNPCLEKDIRLLDSFLT